MATVDFVLKRLGMSVTQPRLSLARSMTQPSSLVDSPDRRLLRSSEKRTDASQVTSILVRVCIGYGYAQEPYCISIIVKKFEKLFLFVFVFVLFCFVVI